MSNSGAKRLKHTAFVSVWDAVFVVHVTASSDLVETSDWPPCCQPLNKKCSNHRNKKIFLSKFPYGWQTFFSWGIPQTTRKFQILEIMPTECRYKKHWRSHTTEARLMQNCANACRFVFISLDNPNVTFFTLILFFYFAVIFSSDCCWRETKLFSLSESRPTEVEKHCFKGIFSNYALYW
jgi:hypothetical protein